VAKTKDFAKVIRARLAADPELAARIEQERSEAKREQALYDQSAALMPSGEALDAMATEPVQAWRDDDGWVDYDKRGSA
jgi:hypothetical protein